MFTHYKNLASRLSEISKGSMENNRFDFNESDSRHYQHIGSLVKDGEIVISVWGGSFYVHTKQQPLNDHTLFLVAEIQKLDAMIPMQEIEVAKKEKSY